MNLGISLANPRALLFIPAFFACLFLLNFLMLHFRKRIESWINPALWTQIIPEFSYKKLKLKNIFLFTAAVLITISLARPQWGEIDEVVQTEGMDIFVLLDLSNSMLAEDASPSRLARSRTFIKKLMTQLEGDRVGVIGFAGNAQLAVPLTTDFQYVADLVDTLDPSAIPSQGTNITEAIETATRALERSGEADHKTTRALVLITDGEDFGENALSTAAKIKDFGVSFFALSVGSTDGAPIPLRNDSGVLQTYKKDSAGKPVLSKVNKDLLFKLAYEAGGQFFELVNPDDAAYSLSRQIRKMSRGALKEQRVVVKIERFVWFLGLGILFLILYLGTGYKTARIIFSIVVISTFSLSSDAQAETTDSIQSYLKSREGITNFKEKKFEDSARSYTEAQKEDPDSAALNFNSGVALGNAGKHEEAISQFQESTRKSLAEGDFATASKSLFNEGVAQGQNGNKEEAYDRLTKAIEMAKISNQPALEKKSREELTRLADEQKKQSESENKDEKDKEDKKDGDSKDQSNKDKNGKKDDQGQGKDDPKEKDQEGKDKDGKDKNGQGHEKKVREFRSGTLNKDTAESIMTDLSDREKQLYHQRLKDKKRKEISNGNDW